MSTSSDHQQTGAPAGGRPSSTQEIPVVPAPLGAAQPTGPVDFVPGIPGAGTLPPPPPPPVAATAPPPAATTAPATAHGPAAEPGPDAPPTAPAPDWPQSLDDDAAAKPGKVRAPRSPRNRAALLGLGLAVLAVVLLEVGLVLPFDTVSFWSAVTLWSAFATLSGTLALLAFAAFYPAGNRLRSSAIWKLAAGGLVGLSVFWVLVVLPGVASDRGFVLTAALACLGAALWIGPRRKD